MFSGKKNHLFFLIALIYSFAGAYAQSTYTFVTSQKDEDCSKGTAAVGVEGLQQNDTLFISWSTGQTNVSNISGLSEGNYNVHVVIKNKADTLINYKIEKIKCRVAIENHFTPNSDNYNDSWNLFNVEQYPKFELYVFNKWGQQVHSQKGTFTEWDGKWNGINVPDGTYYYVFYYDGGNKNDIEKGDLTILR